MGILREIGHGGIGGFPYTPYGYTSALLALLRGAGGAARGERQAELVADDHDEVRQLIAWVLRPSALAVVEAGDGDAALDADRRLSERAR